MAQAPIESRVREVGTRALKWQSAATAVTQILLAAVSLAVAAVVSPGEYALWGIVAIVFNAKSLVKLGLGPSLIYHRFESREDLRDGVDSAFAATLALATLLGAVVALGAPYLADFLGPGFDRSDLILALQVMAVALFFLTLEDVPLGLIEKEMEFRRRSIIEISTSVLYTAVGVGLLFAGAGVWSLIVARCVHAVVRTACFWVAAPVRPRRRPRVRRAMLGRLIKYGVLLNVAGLLSFAHQNLDTLAIGHVVGAAATGAYVLAYTIAQLTPQFLLETLVRVFFPLYAAVRDKRDALHQATTAALRLIAIVMFPVTAALVLLAPDLLVATFGDEWRAARVLLQILALYALLRTFGFMANSLLAATGRPGLPIVSQVLALAVPAALIVPATNGGAEGVAWAFTAGQVAFVGYAQWMARDLVPASAWPKLLLPAAATGVAALAAVGVASIGSQTAWEWGALVLFGAAYVGVLMAIDPWARRNIGGIVRLRPDASGA